MSMSSTTSGAGVAQFGAPLDEATISTFVELGASGDLANRLLFPALGKLLDVEPHRRGLVLLGAGADSWDDETWEERVRTSLEGAAVSGETVEAVLATTQYQQVDVTRTEDLQRLIELLGGTELRSPGLSLIEEVVSRAARGGLDVSCRFEGDHDGVAGPTAHVAFRVVQESLTNALRYAPGAAVRVLVSRSGRCLRVRVENDHSVQDRPQLSGTGRGLVGLRERVQDVGGQLLAEPTSCGGWLVEATLPT